MRYSTATQLSLLLGSAHALTEIGIEKKTYQQWGNALPAQLVHKRDSSGTDSTNVFSILTYSTGGAYYANVTIGTPPQNQVVILDTGSSDLYFDEYSAPACQSTTASNSCRGGTFNPDNSKTYKVVSANGFSTAFGDGSTASGPYSTDTLGIGSWSIANVQFGLASKVNSTTGYAVGLMGIGYSALEATASNGQSYPNVPEILKDAGVTQSRLYSVFLNDVGVNSGSILFGGVDQSKYTGSLVTLNLLPEIHSNYIYQFITTVTAFSTSVNGKSANIVSGGTDSITAYGNSNPALAVLLDTGSSAWTVPTNVYNAVIKQFSYVDRNGYCSCSHRTSGDTLTLTFGGKVQITVPAEEFIVPVYDPTTDLPVQYSNNGDQMCAFMLSPPSSSDGQGFLTLGDAVLRSMYVVFDLDNAQVSLAQASVNSTASPNIVKVGTSGVAAAVSGVSSIAKNTNSIATAIRATQTFVASTIATAVGTAAGIDAVPTDARPIGGISGGSSSSSSSSNSGSGSGSGVSGASQSSSKAAAAGLVVPAFYWPGLASLAVMAVMAVGGAALVI